MHFESTGPGSTFNLPRAGGVSFCVQETWVLNETIRDNILFGTPYEEERYKKGEKLVTSFVFGNVNDKTMQSCINAH